MKLLGYADEDLGIPESLHLAEVILEADAAELRIIAEFLRKAADNMDRMKDTYDHEHLSEADPSFQHGPHLVVVRPK